MTELHSPEMYDLLAKYFAGEADDAEVSQLMSWKDMSPANSAEFEKLKQLWVKADTADWASTAGYDADAAWDSMQFRLDDASAKDKKTFSFWSLRTLSRIAAILIIATISAYVVYFLATKPADIIRISCTGPAIEKMLSDSSVITLKNNSVLSYSKAAFGVKERKVAFSGTGYFKIASNREKPFIVDLQGLHVRVVGTEFNIDSRGGYDTATVSVIKGTVVLADSAGARVVLTAGQQGIYSKRNASLTSRSIVDRNVLAWKTKTLIFEKTEIREVVKVLEIVYERKIIVKKEMLNDCRITATFNNEDLDTVIRVIAQTFNMKVHSETGNYILDGNGCRE